MKKGFTLPEILITLTIIGIVATLTLPALNANINERNARTGLKKAINVLTNAGQLNMSNRGWSYDNVVAFPNVQINDISLRAIRDYVTLFSLLLNNLSVDMDVTTGYGTGPVPSPAPLAAIGVNRYFYLSDGTAVYFDIFTAGANTATLQADNLPLGYDIIYDINGAKGPNILSNCLGNAAGARDSLANSLGNAEGSDCSDPSKRVIKDQFLIRLRGSVAKPSGAASRWLFNG